MYRNAVFHNVRAWKGSLPGQLQQPLKSPGVLLTSVGTGTVPDTWSSWNMNSPENSSSRSAPCSRILGKPQLALRPPSAWPEAYMYSHQAKFLKMVHKRGTLISANFSRTRSYSCSATTSTDTVHNRIAWQWRVLWGCDCAGTIMC